MMAMATATAAVGGTDNNQPIGAAEEMMAAATVTVAEITTATVAVMTMTLTPMPTSVH